jgi:predicted RNA binding protein YcfA (HicA-like mRNA interferase family)
VARLPVVSGKELVSVLTKRFGYYVRDQRGSHVHRRHPKRSPLTIPMHGTIAKGTLRAIMRDAGISRDELIRFL